MKIEYGIQQLNKDGTWTIRATSIYDIDTANYKVAKLKEDFGTDLRLNYDFFLNEFRIVQREVSPWKEVQ